MMAARPALPPLSAERLGVVVAGELRRLAHVMATRPALPPLSAERLGVVVGAVWGARWLLVSCAYQPSFCA